jgi:hypothetical protein
MYQFVIQQLNGLERVFRSVKEAFDAKGLNDRVFVAVIGSQDRYLVLRP